MPGGFNYFPIAHLVDLSRSSFICVQPGQAWPQAYMPFAASTISLSLTFWVKVSSWLSLLQLFAVTLISGVQIFVALWPYIITRAMSHNGEPQLHHGPLALQKTSAVMHQVSLSSTFLCCQPQLDFSFNAGRALMALCRSEYMKHAGNERTGIRIAFWHNGRL